MLSNAATRTTVHTVGVDNQGTTQIVYRIQSYDVSSETTGALIDGGPNGGMPGNDLRIIETMGTTADVLGIAHNILHNLPIGTGAAFIANESGPIIGIFHLYAAYGRTIHSALQLRTFGSTVNDIPSRLLGGSQKIITPDGYTVPLFFRNGLACMDMRPPTEQELDTLPHVIFTKRYVLGSKYFRHSSTIYSLYHQYSTYLGNSRIR